MNDARGLGSLMLINVLVGSASGIMLLALPLYTISLHASAAEMGLIGGMAGAGRMLIIVPSGVWADRYGTRRLFVLSALICVALTALIPRAQSTEALMAIMFFQGMAQSIGFLTLQAGFLKRMKYLQASRAGWQRSATQLGFYLIGPLAAAALLDKNNFIPAFYTVNVLLLCGVAVVIYRSRKGIREVIEYTRATPYEELKHTLALLKDRNLLAVMAIELLNAAVFALFRTFLAPVATDVLHLPPQAVSWMVITQGTVAMATLFWGGLLFSGRSDSCCFNIAAVTTLTGNAVMAVAGGSSPFWFGTILYGVGTGMLGYYSLIRLTRVAGDKGKIAALFSLSVAVGSTFGPVVGGVVGEAAGMQSIFFTPVVLLFVILIVQLVRTLTTSRLNGDSELMVQASQE
jgi:MFS family permease